MNLSKKEIIKLSEDSLIKLTESEINHIYQNFKNIITKIDSIQGISITNIKPLDHLFENVNDFNSLRDDKKVNNLDKKDVFKNSSKHDENYIIIDKVIA